MTLLQQAQPCPFCNGQGERDTYGLWFWDKGVPGRWAVACSNPECSATGPLGETAIDAVVRWNAAPRLAGQNRPAIQRVLDEAHEPNAERELEPGHGRRAIDD